jgi:hypothetical protein
MGFEPTTPTLARLCSTPELHPHPKEAYHHRYGWAWPMARPSYAKECKPLQHGLATAPMRHYQALKRNDFGLNWDFALASCLGHDLFRPAFARRNVKLDDLGLTRFRAGGKPVPPSDQCPRASFFGIMP